MTSMEEAIRIPILPRPPRARLREVLAALAVALAVPAHADSVAEKAALCAACHGENGVPLDRSVPVIWGQQQGYLYVELRDYKFGNRKNELMQAAVAKLDKADFMPLAAYFAAKPWPNLEQPNAPAATVRQALVVAGSAGCTGCHLEAYQGDSVTPRLAGQTEAYLQATLAAFRSGERNNNAWMTDLLKTFAESDLGPLAQYLAGL
jgi:cytochrome c553